MAFRTEALRAIGGFDPQFTIAGDDVDVCWRIQERGGTLGFTAGAMVWHHRRPTVRRFWRQQLNYGAAEAQLQKKWPQRYTRHGRIAWAGRLYDAGASWAFGRGTRRIYHGTWGSALFQSVYHASASAGSSLGLMPEWYLLIAALLIASVVGVVWHPLLLALPLLGVAVCVSVAQAAVAAGRATFAESRARIIRARLLTTYLHLMQPLARLVGRSTRGMTPWPRRGARHPFAWPVPRTLSVWHETWQSGEQRLETLERALRERSIPVRRGGDYDRWDLELRGGLFGAARLRMTIEEHGSGKQMARFRVWPHVPRAAWIALTLCVALVAGLGWGRHWTACAVSALVAVLVAVLGLFECGSGTGVAGDAIEANHSH
jgi:hypothetical protein